MPQPQEPPREPVVPLRRELGKESQDVQEPPVEEHDARLQELAPPFQPEPVQVEVPLDAHDLDADVKPLEEKHVKEVFSLKQVVRQLREELEPRSLAAEQPRKRAKVVGREPQERRVVEEKYRADVQRVPEEVGKRERDLADEEQPP